MYVVEGYKASAANYKSAFEGQGVGQSGIWLDPLFPLSMFGQIVDTILIWGICSGIIALSLSLNNYDLMMIAKRRRTLYLVFIATGSIMPISLFIAPESMTGLHSSLSIVWLAYSLIGITSAILIMGLMRKAANSLLI